MSGSDIRIQLPSFEGPLDLLLHLVRKHELEIVDIPVSFITEKYLEHLDLMRSLSLDVAGEYLVMAATLVHLKSRELLPAPDPTQDDPAGDEEEEDPRQELIRRLLEYQKYKDAAEQLMDQPVVGRNVWTRGAAADDIAEGVDSGVDAPLAEFPVHKLIEALSSLMAKARVKMTHEVQIERLTITDRIHQLAERLDAEGTFTFTSCFGFIESGESTESQLKHQIVVTFLAVLEMARLKLIRIAQPPGESEIFITRAVENVREQAAQPGLAEAVGEE
jgi:segregation and condensation protein A